MYKFLAAILVAGPTLACSCVNTGTACSAVGGPSVIFVADVLVDSGEGWGTGPAKVAIVEALQNVPEGLKETTIETMAGSSCYRRLRAGMRYVIFTMGPRYAVGGCNETFALAGKEHILEAIRHSLRGGPPSLVGSVLKSTGRFSHEGGVAAAEVVLEKGGLKYSAISDSDGRYVMNGLEQGRYQIRVSRAGFVADEEFNNRWSGRTALNPKNNTVEVVKGEPGVIEIFSKGCQIRDLAMWAKGGFRGKVSRPDGKPIEGVTVQAFGFDSHGKRESSPLRTGVSGVDGKYSIEPLPSGKYVVGINASTHEDESPYRPTVYDGGMAMAVAESRSIEGVDFVLLEPRVSANLRIRVMWPDGEPYAGASVGLYSPAGLQRWHSRSVSNEKGEIVAQVYLGERYTVRASHHRFDRELKGIVEVEVNAKDVQVSVVLREEAQGRK